MEFCQCGKEAIPDEAGAKCLRCGKDIIDPGEDLTNDKELEDEPEI